MHFQPISIRNLTLIPNCYMVILGVIGLDVVGAYGIFYLVLIR